MAGLLFWSALIWERKTVKNPLSKALVPLIVMVSVVLAPIAVGAASAAYGPGTCATPTVRVSPSTVGRGQTFTVGISGTCANVAFTIQVRSHNITDTLGTLTTNASGSASGSFVMPTNIADGTQTITVTSSFGTTGSAPITVSGGAAYTGPGAGSGSSSSGLPLTGTDAEATAAIGAGAVLLGGLLVMAVRRRRIVQFQ